MVAVPAAQPVGEVDGHAVALGGGEGQAGRHPAAQHVPDVGGRSRQGEAVVGVVEAVAAGHAGQRVTARAQRTSQNHVVAPSIESVAIETVAMDLGPVSPGARRAPLLPMCAVVRTQLVLEVKWPVPALRVVVADHVVRAGNHAARAPGAQTGVDDFFVELFKCISFLLISFSRNGNERELIWIRLVMTINSVIAKIGETPFEPFSKWRLVEI